MADYAKELGDSSVRTAERVEASDWVFRMFLSPEEEGESYSHGSTWAPTSASHESACHDSNELESFPVLEETSGDSPLSADGSTSTGFLRSSPGTDEGEHISDVAPSPDTSGTPPNLVSWVPDSSTFPVQLEPEFIGAHPGSAGCTEDPILSCFDPNVHCPPRLVWGPFDFQWSECPSEPFQHSRTGEELSPVGQGRGGMGSNPNSVDSIDHRPQTIYLQALCDVKDLLAQLHARGINGDTDTDDLVSALDSLIPVRLSAELRRKLDLPPGETVNVETWLRKRMKNHRATKYANTLSRVRKRNVQFNQKQLGKALASLTMAKVMLEKLGGQEETASILQGHIERVEHKLKKINLHDSTRRPRMKSLSDVDELPKVGSDAKPKKDVSVVCEEMKLSLKNNGEIERVRKSLVLILGELVAEISDLLKGNQIDKERSSSRDASLSSFFKAFQEQGSALGGLAESVRALPLVDKNPSQWNGPANAIIPVGSIKRVIEDFSLEKEEERLKTFQPRWVREKHAVLSAERMAKAGLFARKDPMWSDLTQCAFCLRCFSGWEPADDPWEVHVAKSPDCEYVCSRSEPRR